MDQYIDGKLIGNLGIMFLAILAVLMVFRVIFIFESISQERNYIKTEIARANSKKRRKYWKRRLRELYICQTPLGYFYRRK